MALDFIRKEHYNTEDLIRIVALLRAPGGCPWDQAQTHASIKKNFIEETYEVIEAINRQSTAGLQEELGDVLLQVALHAQMEAEAGRFDFNDVADGICKKLIFRHPHVFGDVKAENTDDAQVKRKRNEKSQPVHGEHSPRIAGTDARPKSAA